MKRRSINQGQRLQRPPMRKSSSREMRCFGMRRLTTHALGACSTRARACAEMRVHGRGGRSARRRSPSKCSAERATVAGIRDLSAAAAAAAGGTLLALAPLAPPLPTTTPTPLFAAFAEGFPENAGEALQQTRRPPRRTPPRLIRRRFLRARTATPAAAAGGAATVLALGIAVHNECAARSRRPRRRGRASWRRIAAAHTAAAPPQLELERRVAAAARRGAFARDERDELLWADSGAIQRDRAALARAARPPEPAAGSPHASTTPSSGWSANPTGASQPYPAQVEALQRGKRAQTPAAKRSARTHSHVRRVRSARSPSCGRPRNRCASNRAA